eukprot:8594668-Pyramimonas_sp.AAC.1
MEGSETIGRHPPVGPRRRTACTQGRQGGQIPQVSHKCSRCPKGRLPEAGDGQRREPGALPA